MKVAVGRLFHESNGFNPHVTRESDFMIRHGDAVVHGLGSRGTTLSGIVSRLRNRSIAAVPIMSASAPPSGRVDHEFYKAVRDHWIDRVSDLQPDAIFLELHGAMATTDQDDAEGDFLAHLRSAVGTNVVIAVGLDLHAHITPEMLSAANICIACKNNPHSDVFECGERVVDLGLEVLSGTLSPVATMAKARTLLEGNMSTDTGPLLELHSRARQLVESNPSLVDISLYNVFRFLDASDIGQAAVVTSHGESASAKAIALDFAKSFWERREDFKDDLMSIEEALDHVAAGRAEGAPPCILADMGDRVLAGAPGDSTAILSAAMRRPDGLSGAVSVTDPDAVSAAHQAGVGETVSVPLGGKLTPGFAPVHVTGRVVTVGDGAFTMQGPYKAGEAGSLGACAVIRVGNQFHILVTSRPSLTHDPQAFESQSIDLRTLDFVVVKSGYHFTLNYRDIGRPLLVATPGVAYYTRGAMRRDVGRFWPEHDVSDDPIILPTAY